MRLKGQVALVTGGSRGIGKAIVQRFAKEGATVAFTYHHSKKSAEAVLESITRDGGKGAIWKCDVAKRNEVQTFVESAVKRFGRLDILVNNAGTVKPVNDLDATETLWDDMLAIHLKGVYFGIQSAVPFMKRNGKIINVSSAAAIKGTQVSLPYAAAKAGVILLTKQLSRTLGEKGITINAIAPGPIETDLLKSFGAPGRREEWIRDIPLHRLGQPDDIANIALFLASQESGFITGQTLIADGGRR
ncbi:3-oxoacyl-ACP reductase FabG [Candidatus Micrarchaeota archaeon]|nr:3-oxoacyl-ACP reductase FabG [Candidatus Micrarchaeota archaeon]